MSIHETIEKFKQQLDTWDSDLSRLENSARETGTQLGDTWNRQVEDIRERSAELRRRFAEVEHAAGAAAEDVKESLELAWNAIKMGVYAVRSEFESGTQEASSQVSPKEAGTSGPATPPPA